MRRVSKLCPVYERVRNIYMKLFTTLIYFMLIKLATQLDINFEPEYIMQDACSASYASARKYFPNAVVLMCFFHVMQNVIIFLIILTIV